PAGKIVYVVDTGPGGDKAAARPVEVTYSFGEQAVVTGLKPGERVVVEGRQNVRPGARVVERAATDEARPRRGPAGAAASGPAANGGLGPQGGRPSSAP